MITLHRIGAVVFRHLMTMRRVSWFVEIAYWTFFDVIIFGSLGKAMAMMAPGSAIGTVIPALITSAVLWYLVLRSAITIGFCLLNELFDANLIALFATPLRTVEWIIACTIVGSITALINLTVGWALALFIFNCNIFALGTPMFAAVCSLLISGWIVGLVLMTVLLFVGKKGTGMAFVICWSLMPFSCVYYPLEVMPQALQTIAKYVPMTHIFTSIRNATMTGASPWHAIAISFGLNALYLIIAVIAFAVLFKRSKKKGLARLELEW